MTSKINSLAMMVHKARMTLMVISKPIRKVWTIRMRMMLDRQQLKMPTHQGEKVEIGKSVEPAEVKVTVVDEVLPEVVKNQILRWSTEPKRTRQLTKMLRRRSMTTLKMTESRLMTWQTQLHWILMMSRLRLAFNVV